MEMFWRTKGKRIAAWLMIALIMATTIPFGSIRASADNTATGESGTVAVTITGQVMFQVMMRKHQIRIMETICRCKGDGNIPTKRF